MIVALYCSDVSGAFDHVDADILLQKLRAFSVPDCILSLLQSWLRPRSGRVVVGGQQSQPIAMIYGSPGHCLGPTFVELPLRRLLHGRKICPV